MDATAELKKLERNRRRKVTIKNAQISFHGIADRYPLIISLAQAVELAGIAPSTLKRPLSEGQYKYCVSRGKPLRSWRDKFAAELFA